MIRKLVLMAAVFYSLSSKAQYCDQLYLVMTSTPNVDFTFDTYGKYMSGLTVNGASLVKVTVLNNVNNNPDCRWNLVVYVDNASSPVTPTDSWEELSAYTSSGTAPKINSLQIRIRNRCNTALSGNNFVPMNILPGVPLYIIENTGITIPAGSCVSGVNGPGDYLHRYDEFSFDIDYRIVPGLGHRSGTYQLRIKYLLAESL